MSWSSTREQTMSATAAGTVTFQPNPDCEPAEETGIVQDFTGTAKKFEETDLYRNAVTVSQPQESQDPCDQPPVMPTFQQRVTRRVEVPFTRRVKVPTTTTKLVPKVVQTEVQVKKLREVDCMVEVEEEYTEICEVERVRDKEIWVKKIIQEKYIERVPRKCTRKVMRPSKRMEEVLETQIVNVETNEVQTVDTFRVDEVQDSKVVEVEELQEIEYRPFKTGRIELSKTRELGRVPGSHLARNTGNVLDEPTAELNEIDNDSNPGRTQPLARYASGDCYVGPGPQQTQATARLGQSYYRQQPGQDPFRTESFTNSAYVRGAGDFQHKMKGGKSPSPTPIGLTVKNTHTKHTDGTGVLVTKVESGSPASAAGFKAGDLITKVAGYPTSVVQQFRNGVLSTDGPLVVVFNRDGRQNIQCTIQR